MKALLASHIVQDNVVPLWSPLGFLEVAGESFALRSQGTEASHAELLQEAIGDVDGGIKPAKSKFVK